ncbi:MAG: choice-of-anchor B family protein [Fimbriimonadaceae bacterium]|nr:choice-of-anchor B family protein [Fimbriimonadaceae bacterium]QYK58427.1 MAG: choice-of-anchor B family protein [Fimbriimonadaceae bacterium]
MAATLLLSSLGTAQYQSDKVTLLAQITLSQFSSSSGNTCWGYISPSGREYAIMGLNNKVTFVEITNPSQPRIVASISHTSNLWADIKTYRYACYVSTEENTGIQVIDLRNIDNNQVTLTRTISAPSRSHTIHVDEVSGFLYTCGSLGRTGQTACFDLKNDPLNPVRVGLTTLTQGLYQHETQVVTYTEGPYAGRQIFFGGGEGRGLEIWDVTNKNATFLIRRVVYPFVGYCHQGWLSSDRRYFYVNDEFDESENGIPTRTLVFDVSVLESADLVSTYTTGLTSIDHNLYTKNDFVFHSNYSSGLQIFNANDNKLAPTRVGWFDTYPADNRVEYVGAWGNWPFFPSGTVIISDMQRGLFIVDVSEATKTPIALTNFGTERGRLLGGNLDSLSANDQNYLEIGVGLVANPSEAPLRVIFESTSKWQDISRIRFSYRNRVDASGLNQTLELYDWIADQWVNVQSVASPLADTSYEVVGPNPDRFVQAGTKAMKARLSVKPGGPVSLQNWKTAIDQASFILNP